MLLEALIYTFSGKYFYFGFKTNELNTNVPALKDVLNTTSNESQSQSQLDRNFDNYHTLAYQILPSDSTKLVTVTDHMRHVVHLFRYGYPQSHTSLGCDPSKVFRSCDSSDISTNSAITSYINNSNQQSVLFSFEGSRYVSSNPSTGCCSHSYIPDGDTRGENFKTPVSKGRHIYSSANKCERTSVKCDYNKTGLSQENSWNANNEASLQIKGAKSTSFHVWNEVDLAPLNLDEDVNDGKDLTNEMSVAMKIDSSTKQEQALSLTSNKIDCELRERELMRIETVLSQNISCDMRQKNCPAGQYTNMRQISGYVKNATSKLNKLHWSRKDKGNRLISDVGVKFISESVNEPQCQKEGSFIEKDAEKYHQMEKHHHPGPSGPASVCKSTREQDSTYLTERRYSLHMYDSECKKNEVTSFPNNVGSECDNKVTRSCNGIALDPNKCYNEISQTETHLEINDIIMPDSEGLDTFFETQFSDNIGSQTVEYEEKSQQDGAAKLNLIQLNSILMPRKSSTSNFHPSNSRGVISAAFKSSSAASIAAEEDFKASDLHMSKGDLNAADLLTFKEDFKAVDSITAKEDFSAVELNLPESEDLEAFLSTFNEGITIATEEDFHAADLLTAKEGDLLTTKVEFDAVDSLTAKEDFHHAEMLTAQEDFNSVDLLTAKEDLNAVNLNLPESEDLEAFLSTFNEGITDSGLYSDNTGTSVDDGRQTLKLRNKLCPDTKLPLEKGINIQESLSNLHSLNNDDQFGSVKIAPKPDQIHHHKYDLVSQSSLKESCGHTFSNFSNKVDLVNNNEKCSVTSSINPNIPVILNTKQVNEQQLALEVQFTKRETDTEQIVNTLKTHEQSSKSDFADLEKHLDKINISGHVSHLKAVASAPVVQEERIECFIDGKNDIMKKVQLNQENETTEKTDGEYGRKDSEVILCDHQMNITFETNNQEKCDQQSKIIGKEDDAYDSRHGIFSDNQLIITVEKKSEEKCDQQNKTIEKEDVENYDNQINIISENSQEAYLSIVGSMEFQHESVGKENSFSSDDSFWDEFYDDTEAHLDCAIISIQDDDNSLIADDIAVNIFANESENSHLIISNTNDLKQVSTAPGSCNTVLLIDNEVGSDSYKYNNKLELENTSLDLFEDSCVGSGQLSDSCLNLVKLDVLVEDSDVEECNDIKYAKDDSIILDSPNSVSSNSFSKISSLGLWTSNLAKDKGQDTKKVKFDCRLRKVTSCQLMDIKMKLNESPHKKGKLRRKSCLKVKRMADLGKYSSKQNTPLINNERSDLDKLDCSVVKEPLLNNARSSESVSECVPLSKADFEDNEMSSPFTLCPNETSKEYFKECKTQSVDSIHVKCVSTPTITSEGQLNISGDIFNSQDLFSPNPNPLFRPSGSKQDLSIDQHETVTNKSYEQLFCSPACLSGSQELFSDNETSSPLMLCPKEDKKGKVWESKTQTVVDSKCIINSINILTPTLEGHVNMSGDLFGSQDLFSLNPQSSPSYSKQVLSTSQRSNIIADKNIHNKLLSTFVNNECNTTKRTVSVESEDKENVEKLDMSSDFRDMKISDSRTDVHKKEKEQKMSSPIKNVILDKPVVKTFPKTNLPSCNKSQACNFEQKSGVEEDNRNNGKYNLKKTVFELPVGNIVENMNLFKSNVSVQDSPDLFEDSPQCNKNRKYNELSNK